MNQEIEKIQNKLEILTKDVDFLKETLSIIQENVHFSINIFWVALGFVVTAAGAALYFLVKSMVNNRLTKEMDKRLVDLLKNNPPLFSASGSSIPDENKKIYLSPEINGIEQLELENIIILDAHVERLIFDGLTGNLKPKIRKNEHGIVEIEIPDYHENKGLVHWKLVWPRKYYDF